MEQRLKAVHERIARAAADAGRDAAEIELVCVSKMHPIEEIERAISLGESSFGENRVDELVEKSNNMMTGANWHLIGQLQTNKVKKIIGRTVLEMCIRDSCMS